jgi:hypothetical protein
MRATLPLTHQPRRAIARRRLVALFGRAPSQLDAVVQIIPQFERRRAVDHVFERERQGRAVAAATHRQPCHFGHFASQELIIVWLEVRVLPAPPRSLVKAEISSLGASSRQTGGDSRTRFVSVICHLDFRGRFGVFVSASQNRVSRLSRLVLAETRFECWVSAAESRASRAASTTRQANR